MKQLLTTAVFVISMVTAAQAQFKKVSRTQTISEMSQYTKQYVDKSTVTNNSYITWQNGEIKIVCQLCNKKVFTYTVTEGRKSKQMDEHIRIDTYKVLYVETGAAATISIGYKDGVAMNLGIYDGTDMILYNGLEDF